MIGNPTEAYLVSALAVFPEELTERMDAPVADGLSWYVQPEIGVVVLLAWLAVPILVGLYRFERADLS